MGRRGDLESIVGVLEYKAEKFSNIFHYTPPGVKSYVDLDGSDLVGFTGFTPASVHRLAQATHIEQNV